MTTSFVVVVVVVVVVRLDVGTMCPGAGKGRRRCSCDDVGTHTPWHGRGLLTYNARPSSERKTCGLKTVVPHLDCTDGGNGALLLWRLMFSKYRFN